MPKTLINEIDSTGGEALTGLVNSVYIPCTVAPTLMLIPAGGTEATEHAFTGLVEGSKAEDLLPHTIYDIDGLLEFEDEVLGTYEDATSGDVQQVPLKPNPDSMSYSLASYLLNNGFAVVLQLVLDNIQDGWTRRFNQLKDKGLYDIKFITMGEFAGGSNFRISDIIGCAEDRGDCIALIDHPRDLSAVAQEDPTLKTYSQLVHKWVEENAVSSYAATFSPWCSNSMHQAIVNNQKTYPMLPPSFSFLAAYANSCKNNAPWLAAAGVSRGFIPGLIKVDRKYGEQDVDVLQCRKATSKEFLAGDNTGVACNPICSVDPFGIIVWGNRTGLNNDGSLKATSLLNIRNLACDIKKTMWTAARRYTFEQDTLSLWFKFCGQISPLLDRAIAGEGIESYRFVREETSARARLKARVIIVPIDAVEDFELSFVMDDTIETEESVG